MLILPLALLLALATGIVANRLAQTIARRLAWLDRPGTEAHKHQARAVPYGGGPACLVAAVVSILILGLSSAEMPAADGRLWGLLGGMAGLFALGQIDDLRPLPARLKLAIQVAIVAAAVIGGGLRVHTLAVAWGPWAGLSAALIWCLLLTNAYNLLDHADGLSAGCAIISAVVLLSAALLGDDPGLALIWCLVIGTLGGFLVWNLPPARLYLGDAGSLPLGFVIGAGALATTFWPSHQNPDGSPLAVMAPVLISAIPLYDTMVVMAKRWRRGRPLMRGDRMHIGHRLQRLGLSQRGSLAAVLALQTALAGAALMLRHADRLGTLVILAQAAAIFITILLLEANRDHDG